MAVPERLLLIGGWGHHYLQDLAGRPGLDLAVAGDGHDELARLRAHDIDGAVWFDDAAEALASFRPDLVSIGCVYGLNGRWLLESVRHGVPAVSDKPIAATWEQLAELEALLAAHPGLPVLTELPLRAEAAFRTARRAVADGRIGEPVLATAQKSYKWGGFRPDWYADRDLYTGTVLWIATHGLDLVRWVTGQEATAVGGHAGNLSQPDRGTMEDHTVTLLALEQGGSAVVHADYLRPESAATHGDDRIRLAGTQGIVEVRDGRCLLIDQGGGPTDVTDDSLAVPVHEALLAALDGDDELYGTIDSLRTARLALEARDVSEWG